MNEIIQRVKLLANKISGDLNSEFTIDERLFVAALYKEIDAGRYDFTDEKLELLRRVEARASCAKTISQLNELASSLEKIGPEMGVEGELLARFLTKLRKFGRLATFSQLDQRQIEILHFLHVHKTQGVRLQ